MRRFEFRKGTSEKFWEVAVEGRAVTVRFGRIGAQGQEKTKSLPTPEAARAEHDQLVAEKLRKGYVEQGRGRSAKLPARPSTDPATADLVRPVARLRACLQKVGYQG